MQVNWLITDGRKDFMPEEKQKKNVYDTAIRRCRPGIEELKGVSYKDVASKEALRRMHNPHGMAKHTDHRKAEMVCSTYAARWQRYLDRCTEKGVIPKSKADFWAIPVHAFPCIYVLPRIYIYGYVGSMCLWEHMNVDRYHIDPTISATMRRFPLDGGETIIDEVNHGFPPISGNLRIVVAKKWVGVADIVISIHMFPHIYRSYVLIYIDLREHIHLGRLPAPSNSV